MPAEDEAKALVGDAGDSAAKGGGAPDESIEAGEAGALLDESSEPAQLSEGDRVTWVNADADVPEGTVGIVQGPSAEHPGQLSVRFPAGQWGFPSSELRLVGQWEEERAALNRGRRWWSCCF